MTHVHRTDIAKPRQAIIRSMLDHLWMMMGELDEYRRDVWSEEFKKEAKIQLDTLELLLKDELIEACNTNT